MKFRNKAESVPADFSDLQNANMQSSITSINVCGVTYGSFGYGYDGGVPSFSEAMKIQTDQLNLVQSFQNPPIDGSKVYFIISIIALVSASLYFVYQLIVTRNEKVTKAGKSNDYGIMT